MSCLIKIYTVCKISCFIFLRLCINLILSSLTGEIVELSRHGVKSHCIVPPPDNRSPAFCIFEYVYFARPDSILEGLYDYFIRW